MTVRREWLNWGVFLIALGAVPLAVYWNLIPAALTQDLLRLWPLVLIALGIGLIMRFTPLAAIGGIFTAAVFGLLVGAVIAGGVGGLGVGGIACRVDHSVPVATRTGELSGQPARFDMELNCGELNAIRQAGNGWSVTTQIADERSPLIEASGDGLRLRSGEGPAANIRRVWGVSLPADVPLHVNLNINAANATVDLGGGDVSSLSATLNASDSSFSLERATQAGSIDMTYNAASGTLALPLETRSASIGLNASSLTLCVPAEAGLMVDWRGTLSAQNFAAAGLQSEGNNRWTVAGTGQINLNINGNVSNIELDRSGGCP